MKVARVNAPRRPMLSSPSGIGGDTALPALDDLTDVDTSGVGIGDTIVWTGTEWIPGTGGGGGFPWWFNVEDYGAVHDGVTDDTVAIQDAIDACMAAGGGTVFFPNGIYAIKGALQSTSTYNSQLTIPQNFLPNPADSTPPVAIELLGMGPASQSNHGTSGPWDPSLSGAILLSDWNGTITNFPAVIAAGKYDAQYPAASFNWLEISFRNIEIRTPANPKLAGIQMAAVASCTLENVTISTDTDSQGMAAPSNTNAIGYWAPINYNVNPPGIAYNVFIDGYYTGAKIAEVFHGIDISVHHCIVGIECAGPQAHAASIDRVFFVAVKTCMKFTGGSFFIHVANWMEEFKTTGTFSQVYDIDDSSNYARGHVSHHIEEYGVAGGAPIVLNGATGLSFHWWVGKEWTLNSIIKIPTGTDPSTNPANGGKLYAASATGHPTWRDSAGTVTDLLTGTGPSFATPAIVLSTAAAAGAASTVIRSDSTIVAFDATVPVTQGYSDAAATGSAAVAARRDHVHGMPAASAGAAHYLVIASSHSTPLIFGDLVQTSAGDDLIYTS